MHRYHHEFSDSQTHHGSSQPQERDFTRPNPFADTHTPETYQSHDALRQLMHPQYQNQGQTDPHDLSEVAHMTLPSRNSSDIDVMRHLPQFTSEPQNYSYPDPVTPAPIGPYSSSNFQSHQESLFDFIDPSIFEQNDSLLPPQQSEIPLAPPPVYKSSGNPISDGTEILNQPAQEAPPSEDNFLRLGSPCVYEIDDQGVRHPILYDPKQHQGKERYVHIHEKKKGPTRIAKDINAERKEDGKPKTLPDGTNLELTKSDITSTTHRGHKIKHFENLSTDVPALREEYKNTRNLIKNRQITNQCINRATRVREYIKEKYKTKIPSITKNNRTMKRKNLSSIEVVLDYVKQNKSDEVYQTILNDPQIQAIQQEKKKQSKKHRPQKE